MIRVLPAVAYCIRANTILLRYLYVSCHDLVNQLPTDTDPACMCHYPLQIICRSENGHKHNHSEPGYEEAERLLVAASDLIKSERLGLDDILPLRQLPLQRVPSIDFRRSLSVLHAAPESK